MLFDKFVISRRKVFVAAICLGIVAVFSLLGYYWKASADGSLAESKIVTDTIQNKNIQLMSNKELVNNVSLNEETVVVEKDKTVKLGVATDSNIRMNLGEAVQLPFVEKERLLSCESGNEQIVTVSKKGMLHALKQGKAKIKVKTKTGKKLRTRIYRITVKKRGMVYPVFSMMKGEHLDLQFSLDGVKAIWESKNPSVATVSKKGKVVAVKKGNTTIIGKTKQGKIYRCKLTVTKKIKSVIYLTFDDGPNRYSTTKVLNILKKNGVKATFFQLKPAKADFDLTKRVLEEEHSLALHGYQHKYDIVYRSQKKYHNNLDRLRNLFFRKFGVWCTVSRFPGGSSNTRSSYNPGIMTKLTGKLHGWGYHYFDWNVDSGDAGGARNEKETFRNFKNGLQKGRSNVVLMHDYQGNDKTINALQKMIHYGKKNGYTFLPITASTSEIHHTVNN